MRIICEIDAMNSPSVESFYDGLANEYHLIFGHWWSAAQSQGGIISMLLAAEGVDPPSEVLDCTCGIGTQALARGPWLLHDWNRPQPHIDCPSHDGSGFPRYSHRLVRRRCAEVADTV